MAESYEHIDLLSLDTERAAQFCREHDTAVLTILFTDIVGFTEFSESAGEETAASLRRLHDTLVTQVLKRDGSGEIIKQIGDSFLAVFSEPSTAVMRALELQKLLLQHQERFTVDGYTLQIRIGIHLGQVSVEEGFHHDVFGRHVNRASRITSIANGKQILTSQAVWDNASGYINHPEKRFASWRICGRTRLKGIRESVLIYEFFLKDMGPSSLPRIIRQSRYKRAAIFIPLLALFLSLILSLYHHIKDNNDTFNSSLLSTISKDTLILASVRTGPEYLDIFRIWRSMLPNGRIDSVSNYYKPINSSDIILINSDLRSKLISLSYPEYIIQSENEFMTSYVNRGIEPPKLFHLSQDSSEAIATNLIFNNNGDNLIMVIIAYHLDNYIHYNLWFRMDNGVSVATSQVKDHEELVTDLTDIFTQYLTRKRKGKSIGRVISSDDSLIIVKLRDYKVQTGTPIRFTRNYVGYRSINDSGVQRRIRDLELVYDAYGDTLKWINEVGEYTWSYNELSDLRSGWMNVTGDAAYTRLPIVARLMVINDSIATIDMLQKEMPGINVCENDIIELEY